MVINYVCKLAGSINLSKFVVDRSFNGFRQLTIEFHELEAQSGLRRPLLFV